MNDAPEINQNAAIVLPIGAWHLVISLLAKAPWETADPLIRSIRLQLTQRPPPDAMVSQE